MLDHDWQVFRTGGADKQCCDVQAAGCLVCAPRLTPTRWSDEQGKSMLPKSIVQLSVIRAPPNVGGPSRRPRAILPYGRFDTKRAVRVDGPHRRCRVRMHRVLQLLLRGLLIPGQLDDGLHGCAHRNEAEKDS